MSTIENNTKVPIGNNHNYTFNDLSSFQRHIRKKQNNHRKIQNIICTCLPRLCNKLYSSATYPLKAMKTGITSSLTLGKTAITSSIALGKKALKNTPYAVSEVIRYSCKAYDQVSLSYPFKLAATAIKNYSFGVAGTAFFSYGAIELASSLSNLSVRSIVPVSNSIMSLIAGTTCLAAQFIPKKEVCIPQKSPLPSEQDFQ